MSTTKDYYDYIMDCLCRVGNVTARRMMGEYCVYYNGRLVGNICDNCLLLKQTPTSLRLLPDADRTYPYAGSRTLMLVVDDAENTALLRQVLDGMYAELPENKKG